MAFGTEPTPTGLADPPIDDLMEHADSKYALAIFAAKRAARSIPISPSSMRVCCRTSARWWNTRIRRSRCPSRSARINSGLLEETLGEDDLTEGN